MDRYIEIYPIFEGVKITRKQTNNNVTSTSSMINKANTYVCI